MPIGNARAAETSRRIRPETPLNRLVVISGCSGGGKSTLLAALAARGYDVVPEPGRRIVQDELARGGAALPWIDLAAFARRAVTLAVADLGAAAARPGWVFFDRSLVDAAAALEHATGEPVLRQIGGAHRFHRRVFMAPPWPEIYPADAERRHRFEEAAEEHRRLETAYTALGYEIVALPKTSVDRRAALVLQMLGL